MNMTDNKAASRFELIEDGYTAFANYRREDNQLFILHVEAPEALRGRGAASRLMQKIVEIAKAEDTEITPICSYAVHWLNKNKA